MVDRSFKRNSKETKIKNYQRGKFAENISSWFLRLKGYQILQRNYKTSLGEIDIIALKKQTLCFVEVKKRNTLEQASYAITHPQKRRIEKSAILYAQQNSSYQNYDLRFDVILIGATVFPYHIKNAWQTG